MHFVIKLTFSDDFVSKDYFKCDITKKRRVEQFEFELYPEDNSLSFINDSRINHSQTTVIFAKPGDERFTIGNFSCRAFHFICDDIDTCNLLNTLPPSALVEGHCAENLHNLMGELTVNDDNMLSVYAGIFSVLNLAFGTEKYEKKSDFSIHKYYKNIMKTRDFIDNHFSQSISLCELADIAYLSSNFYRIKFKEIIGMTPCEYIADIRLSHAVKLIKTSELSIAEISRQCGFGSQNYLNHIIKSRLNKTPVELRKESAEKVYDDKNANTGAY